MNTPDDYIHALQRWHELKGSRENDRVQCTVEFFGIAQLLTKTKTISVALPQEATLSHLFYALAERMPVLVGRVISSEKNELMSGCACNVNGLEFVRNPSAKIRTGDKILILSADAGG
jgi:molybdopterin converting factor small subunit